MHGSLIRHRADVGVLNADIKTLLGGQSIELVVDVVSILDVLLEADDCKALKGFGLVHHRVEAVGVIEGARDGCAWVASWRRLRWRLVIVVVLVSARSLLLEVWSLVDLRLLEDFGFDGVWVQRNFQTPLLDLFRLSNHLVQLLDRVDSIVRFLEKTLSHLGYSLFILPHLLGDAHQHGELGWEVDVLALLLDFEEGLVHLHDLHVVLLLEVGSHRNGGASLTLLEVTGLRAHVKTHVGYLVGLVVTVHGHHDCTLEFVDHRLLELLHLRRVVAIPLALLSEPVHLVINQLEAVVNRQILADVVDDQIETSLEDPGGSEETWPGLDGVVKHLGLGAHEESRVAPNLAQVRVAHLGLDDRVDEVQGEGVLLHAH